MVGGCSTGDLRISTFAQGLYYANNSVRVKHVFKSTAIKYSGIHWLFWEKSIKCSELIVSWGWPCAFRRVEALPIFRRRLLGGLMDFATRELQSRVIFISCQFSPVQCSSCSFKVRLQIILSDQLVLFSVALLLCLSTPNWGLGMPC